MAGVQAAERAQGKGGAAEAEEAAGAASSSGLWRRRRCVRRGGRPLLPAVARAQLAAAETTAAQQPCNRIACRVPCAGWAVLLAARVRPAPCLPLPLHHSQAMHSQLEEVFGAPEAINPEEVAKEARAMMTQDVIQQMERKVMKDKGAAASKLAAAAAARVGRMPAARGGRARLQAAASALSQLD